MAKSEEPNVPEENSSDNDEDNNPGGNISPEQMADRLKNAGQDMADAIIGGLRNVFGDALDIDDAEMAKKLADFWEATVPEALPSAAQGAVIADKTGRDLISEGEPAQQLGDVVDEAAFLSWLIGFVPDGSVWAFEGVFDDEEKELIAQYAIEDDVNVYKATIYPDLPLIKLRLDRQSRPALAKRLADDDFASALIHQHVYHGDSFYLTAYDRLQPIWLSARIPESEVMQLYEGGIVKPLRSDGESERA